MRQRAAAALARGGDDRVSAYVARALPAQRRVTDIAIFDARLPLFIALFAVYRSAKITSKNWMKYALWSSWVILFTLIINEQFSLIVLPESTVQISALILIGLHIYNLKKLSL